MRNKPTTKKSGKKFSREIIIACLLAAAVFLVFSPAIRYGTVYYDDSDYVGADNPYVEKGLSKDGIVWAFTTGHASNWHPLTWLSHMLDVEIFGNKPAGAHFTNILLHVFNTVLLFLILKRMTGTRWRSAFVAALFGMHPLHVESVAWISERKDVLCTFFWLLAIWAYAEYVQSPKSKAQSLPLHAAGKIRRPIFFYLLALFFFALGLMSKPMVVTLPFALLLLDIWPLRRIDFRKEPSCLRLNHPQVRPAALLVEKIPFFVLTVIASIVTFLVQKKDGAVSSLTALPLSGRIENALISYVRYIAKMLWPIDLAPLYPLPSHWPFWQVCGAILFLLGISVGAIRLLRRQPYFFTGWFWFLGTLVPVIGLVQVGSQAMADRYTYIPLIGLFIVATWGGLELFSHWRFSKIAVGCSAIILLLGCVILTKQQVGYWRDTELLFGHAAKVTKKNYVAYGILGLFFFDQGRRDEALEAYHKSIELLPTYADAHNNLGYALAQIGKHDEAIEHLRTALKLKPGYIDAHNNLGISLAATGKIDEAISHYEIVLATDSKNAKAHNNLGIALMTRGDSAEAIEHFHAACKLKPDYLAAVNGLAWILATHPNPKFRDGTEAVRLAFHAVELTNEKDAGILETLGAAYAESGDFSNALKRAQSATALAEAGGDEEMKSRLASEFQLYSANQPFRDSSFKEN